ncbi:MAG: formylglycine-generating enzyme family protein [Planctomycetota bacterium]|jgi:formylglycine-generating enzyme required for sulfatase activity|nr:formylglycine-generating enzyme family protein [Planctomycetota bacterium]
MKKLFVLAFLCCLVGMRSGASAGEADDYYVVETEGMGRNRAEAIDQAWIEAIRSSVGMMTDIRTEVSQDEVSETIIAHSRGLVEKYEILMADDSLAGEGVYRIRLKAWVRKDILRDGLEYVASRGQVMAFSIEDLKRKDELDPGKAESLDPRESLQATQGREAARFIVQLLRKYKQADFVNLAIAGKPELAEGGKDTLRIELAVSFNEDFYYKSFLPEAKKLFAQIAKSANRGYYRNQEAVENIRKLQNSVVGTGVSIYGKYADDGFDVILPDAKNTFSYNGYLLTGETLANLAEMKHDIDSRFHSLAFQIRFFDDEANEVYQSEGSVPLTAFRNNNFQQNKQVFYPSLLIDGKTECLRGTIRFEFLMPEELLVEVKSMKLEIVEEVEKAVNVSEVELPGNVRMAFMLIRAGTFTMGSPASEGGRGNDEIQHRVTLTKPFYLGIYEVTQKQWQAVMGTNPSRFKGDRRPVENVSWNDANEFCKKLLDLTSRKFRLPTEAEWEYACRAGTTTPFNTGATISTDQVNYNGDYVYGNGTKGVYRKQTTDVGSFLPNAWGLYDMHGNVWEWCSDWYGDYPKGAVSDPKGLGSGSNRVLRGGGWSYNPLNCRSATRTRNEPGNRDDGDGFRVVLDQ